jgi:hypothetical protein
MEDITFNMIVSHVAKDTATMFDDTYIRHYTEGSITTKPLFLIRELPDRVKSLGHIWRYFNGDDWTYEQISKALVGLYYIYQWALPRMTETQKLGFWRELKLLESETNFLDRLTNINKYLEAEGRNIKFKTLMTFKEFLSGVNAVF